MIDQINEIFLILGAKPLANTKELIMFLFLLTAFMVSFVFWLKEIRRVKQEKASTSTICEETINKKHVAGRMQLEEFRHQGLGVRFDHPKGWQARFADNFLYILPPKPEMLTGKSGLYALGITLLVAQKTNFREEPESLLRTFLSECPSKFERFKLLHEENIRLSSGHFAIEYSFDFQECSYPFRAYAVISVRNDMLFSLDISGLKSKILPISSDCKKVVRSLCL